MIQKSKRSDIKYFFEHRFSDQNYSKVCKCRRCESSPSFFFLLIFHIAIVQWPNCWNMKDELNFSYNSEGVAYLLQCVAINFIHTVWELLFLTKDLEFLFSVSCGKKITPISLNAIINETFHFGVRKISQKLIFT